MAIHALMMWILITVLKTISFSQGRLDEARLQQDEQDQRQADLEQQENNYLA